MTKTNPLYVEIIDRAAMIAGGRDNLAKLLKISASDLESWHSGSSEPPHQSFTAMLDLISRGRPGPDAVQDGAGS